MKILLVSPIVAVNRTPAVYNIGLGYIASSLIQAGHDVSILDIEGHRYKQDEVLKIIKGKDYDIVGLGTLITGYKYTKWLVKEIRKIRPDIDIWMGNSIASTIPEMAITDMGVDIVVMGEGEETVKDLAKVTEEHGDISKVKGIVFKNGADIIRTPERPLIGDIDTLPFPAWEMFPQNIYMYAPTGRLPLPTAYISTTRGCPYNCTYCYHPFQNKKVRTHSALRVVEEISILKRKYKVRGILFADDLFMVDKKRIHEICDLIEKKKLNIKWIASSRVNTLDEDVLRHMKYAGCISLCFGIESGSQKILNNIKKNATVGQAKDAIRLVKKSGIEPVCSYMIGNVGETRETVFETVSFIIKNMLEITSLFLTTPYPDTELYKYAKENGKIKDEISLFESYGEQADTLLVNFTDMSDDELLNLKKEAESVILKRFILKYPHKFIYYIWKKLPDYYFKHGVTETFEAVVKAVREIF